MKTTRLLSNCVIFILSFLFLYFTSNLIAQEIKDTSKEAERQKDIFDGYKNKRTRYFFVIGEKAIDSTGNNVHQGIRNLRNHDKINTFSILDVKLKNDEKDFIPFLESKNMNLLLVAELKKKNEETWNRISIMNKYTWEVEKRSVFNEEKKEEPTKPANEEKKEKLTKPEKHEGMKTFYVEDLILSENPFIKKGDRVQALFFFDVGKDRMYLKDLKKAQQKSLPIMSIDAQEMYLITVGSTPQEYSAKDGDEIRLRFIRAEYPIETLPFIKQERKERENIPSPISFADLLSIEDEIRFEFKDFGLKLKIVPSLVFGSRPGSELDNEEFNPKKQNPAFGSNVYITYEGRSWISRQFFKILPGIHFSFLKLKDSNEPKFTLGFVTSILPGLRKYFGIFYGWLNLDKKDPVIGITFSTNIDIEFLVKRTKEKK